MDLNGSFCPGDITTGFSPVGEKTEPIRTIAGSASAHTGIKMDIESHSSNSEWLLPLSHAQKTQKKVGAPEMGRFPQVSERKLLMDSMESHGQPMGKPKAMVKTYPFIVAGKDRMSFLPFFEASPCPWLQGQYRVWTYNLSGANKPKRNNLNETPESCKEVLCVLNYTVLANVLPISGDPSPPCH